MLPSFGRPGAALVVRVLVTIGLWGGAACGAQTGCDYAIAGVPEFLQLAKNLYQKGIFKPSDQERVARVLQSGEALPYLCAAAYLQALLIKLEENIVYGTDVYRIVLESYVDILHQSIQNGRVSSEDLERWPLRVGFERVKKLRSSLQFQRNFTTAMVLNFCQKEDRFGEVHALDWILRHPLGWKLDEEHWPVKPDAAKLLLQDTDLYMYLVDAEHCEMPPEELVRGLQRAMRSVHLLPYKGGPRREEQSAYFKFVVDHYENLPDFTIFVHPDSNEHQGREFVAMSRALQLIKTGSKLAEQSIRYYPIALQMVVDPMRIWGEGYREDWDPTWERLFHSAWPDSFRGEPACRWSVHYGAFLKGYTDEREGEYMPRGKARLACIELGEACKGITCEAQAGKEEENYEDPLRLQPHGSSLVELQCTLRRGEEEGSLFESPSGERTYVKNCSSSSNSSSNPSSPSRKHSYIEQRGVFLPGYAADDPTVFADVAAAQQHCNSLGDTCAGVTCAGVAEECSCRSHSKPEWSPMDEVSYIKVSHSTLPPGNLANGASNRYQAYMGSHAIVHKDRILARPRAEYAALGQDLEFCSNHTGLMEAMWHVFFGEPLSQWPRELDPRLPLALKWGTQTIYHYGDEGII